MPVKPENLLTTKKLTIACVYKKDFGILKLNIFFQNTTDFEHNMRGFMVPTMANRQMILSDRKKVISYHDFQG